MVVVPPGRSVWSQEPGSHNKRKILKKLNYYRKSLVQEEKGLTLMELMVAVFILAVVLTPIIAYFSRNLSKVSQVRNASIALNLAKQEMEKVESLGFILGVFYVLDTNQGSFVDGYTSPTAQSLKLRVVRMGSSSLTVQINSGEATGVIPADTSPGTLIDVEGPALVDVTNVAITGGSFKDRFDIIYQYPDSIQTIDEASWRTTYEFSNPSTPLKVTVKVFKGTAIDSLAEMVTTVEGLE